MMSLLPIFLSLSLLVSTPTLAQTEDTPPNVQHLEQEAAEGDVKAQLKLALLFDAGQEVEQNTDLAIKWYTKAAEQNSISAQYNLAQIYENGYGVPQDVEEAIRWFTKSATLGHPPSQFNLGHIYEYGAQGNEVGNQDLFLAKVWYQTAAENGHGEAMAGYQRVSQQLTNLKEAKQRQETIEELKATFHQDLESEKPASETVTPQAAASPRDNSHAPLWLIVTLAIFISLTLGLLALALKNNKQLKTPISARDTKELKALEAKLKNAETEIQKLNSQLENKDLLIKKLSFENKLTKQSPTPSSSHSFNALQLMGFEAMPSKAELKSNYRKLVKIYHPDKGADSEVMVKVNAAYQKLLSEIE